MYTLEVYKYDKHNKKYYGDWTAISDIGKNFHGKVLTFEEYLKEEDRHVQLIVDILNSLQVKSLDVRYLGKSASLRVHQIHHYLNSNLGMLYQELENGLTLSTNRLQDAIRLSLRECIDCLFIDEAIEIAVDYDYYLEIHLYSNNQLNNIINIINSNGFFWKLLEHPQIGYDAEEQLAYNHTWGDGQTNPPGDYHHDLRISKDNPQNRTYTEWSHFDEIGHGLDWEKYQATEQKYLQLVLDFLEFFQVNQLAVNGGLGFTTIQELGVPAHYFSPQEEALFQQLQEYDETVEDWTIEAFIIPKEDFATLFQLIFKGRLRTWISTDLLTIQFDSSYRLYLSFYAHKKEIQNLIEKHGLYWQERQPPYKEAVGFR